MKTHKIFIRFGLISKRLNQKGCAAIQCRITYNKNRKDFATGLFINPDHWDPKKDHNKRMKVLFLVAVIIICVLNLLKLYSLPFNFATI